MGIFEPILPEEGNLWPYYGFPDFRLTPRYLPLRGLLNALFERIRANRAFTPLTYSGHIVTGYQYSWYYFRYLGQYPRLEDRVGDNVIWYSNVNELLYHPYSTIDYFLEEYAGYYYRITSLPIQPGTKPDFWTFNTLLQFAADATGTEAVGSFYSMNKTGFSRDIIFTLPNKDWLLQRYVMINMLRFVDMLVSNVSRGRHASASGTKADSFEDLISRLSWGSEISISDCVSQYRGWESEYSDYRSCESTILTKVILYNHTFDFLYDEELIKNLVAYVVVSREGTNREFEPFGTGFSENTWISLSSVTNEIIIPFNSTPVYDHSSLYSTGNWGFGYRLTTDSWGYCDISPKLRYYDFSYFEDSEQSDSDSDSDSSSE